MWPGPDRRLGEVIKLLERRQQDDKQERLEKKAEEYFKKTLEKLWPLTSNEKPS